MNNKQHWRSIFRSTYICAIISMALYLILPELKSFIAGYPLMALFFYIIWTLSDIWQNYSWERQKAKHHLEYEEKRLDKILEEENVF